MAGYRGLLFGTRTLYGKSVEKSSNAGKYILGNITFYSLGTREKRQKIKVSRELAPLPPLLGRGSAKRRPARLVLLESC